MQNFFPSDRCIKKRNGAGESKTRLCVIVQATGNTLVCVQFSGFCLREVNHSVTRHKALETAPTNHTLLWLPRAGSGPVGIHTSWLPVFSLHCFCPTRALAKARCLKNVNTQSRERESEQKGKGEVEERDGEEVRQREGNSGPQFLVTPSRAPNHKEWGMGAGEGGCKEEVGAGGRESRDL